MLTQELLLQETLGRQRVNVRSEPFALYLLFLAVSRLPLSPIESEVFHTSLVQVS